MGDGYDMAQTLDYDDFFDDIDGASDEPGKFCADCDKAFFTNGLLEIHRQKVHDDASLLACSTCNVDFKRKMGLITHWRTAPAHRRNDGVKLIGCDICDAFNIVNGFRDEEAVEVHTKHVHGEHVLVNTADQAKSYCPLCRSEFAYRKGMIEHLQVLHGEHLLTELLGVTGLEKDRLMEDLHFKCHFCSKVFRVKKSLNQHMEKMHPTAGVNDTTTTTNTNSPSSLLTPVVILSGSPQVKKVTPTVSIIPAGAVSPATIARLTPPPAKMARISNSDPDSPPKASPVLKQVVPPPPPPTSNDHVICPICSRTFSRQSVLNVHTQMVHTNTKANMLLRPKPNFEVSQNVDDSVEDFLDGGSFFDDE